MPIFWEQLIKHCMKPITKALLALVIILAALFLPFFKTDIPFEEMKARYAKTPSAFLEIEGMPVHYRAEGRSDGIPLLLIHGTSSSLFTWDGWVKHMKDSLPIIRIDLPGFGLTGPHPERNYGIDMYTRVIATLMQHLGHQKCYVAGNSLGGYIAWNLAIEYPEMVEKVILVDAVAYHSEIPIDSIPVKDNGHSLAFSLAKNPLFSFFMRWVTPKYLVEKSLKEVYFDKKKVSPELTDLYFDMIRRAGNREAFIDNIQSRVPEGGEKKLASLHQPVLIQWGKEDAWIDVSLAYWFRAILPVNELIIYEGAGHVPMEEIPEATARDAIQFIFGQ
jgi:pimeloyl-ACP methyl ester carboxylesterase